MDNSYSLSDIAAATGNNWGNGWGNGWGGGLGTSVIAGVGGGLLASALFGNGGWGNNGCNRGNCATTEDLASGFNFQALQNKGNETLSAIQNTNQNLSNAVCQLGYQSLDHASTLGSKIDGCCCTTQRAVDGVKFDMANYASGLQIAQMQGTQKVLDKLCSMESAQKDAVIAQQGQRIAALEADARMCGIPRTNPYGYGIYAYPTCNPCCNGQVTMG